MVRLDLARQIVNELEKLTAAGESNDPESFHTWSLRLLEAEKRATPENQAPVAAFEGHVQRMKRMLQVAEGLSVAGQTSSGTVSRWKFFLKEADRLLEDARGAAPGGGMGMMMAGMMGGGRGIMAGPAGGMMPGGAAPAAPPAATTQPPPPAAASGGGGFGGGGGADAQDEQEARVTIARISSLLSTIDKNPKSLAVIKKLEEPVTLHFPEDTPLQEVLKHIKDVSKGSDGQRIPIYVDPLGLQEADKMMTSPVTIDLEDTPLRFSLRLVLKQLGLAYCVRDGVVIISSVPGIEQELREAAAEQGGLNPDKLPAGMMMQRMGGVGSGMGGMGGGMGGMGRPAGMM